MSDSELVKTIKTKPFVDANIAEIHEPGKYRIVGKIANISQDSLVVDDGFEQLIITIPEHLEIKLEEGLKVRAFGYVSLQPEKTMKTSFIQDFGDIDIEAYRQINELEQSLRRTNK